MTTAGLLDRFNAAHPWSHNDAFAGFVMRQARAVQRTGGTTAVDVGCGTGNLLACLSPALPTIIGIEPDAGVAQAAARRFHGSNVRIENRRFGDEPPNAYDLIVFVASLHHMPLEPTLSAARDALRPGGRLVIVGIAKETPDDAVRSAVSMVLNPLIGLAKHPRRATHRPQNMQAPVTEPVHTFDEIRAVASGMFPGIRMRRRLFWRYTASWIAPR